MYVRRCDSFPAARSADLWKDMRWVTAKGARRIARVRKADMAMVTFCGCGSGSEGEGDASVDLQGGGSSSQ